ncbi:hypothetical protein DUI87_25246 [Hirundo rustica rustica]|uniref:Uncharacterized protein n=1 Tax=Hirundo rustica rustica TaxID=333673 RepID=A0A3M0JB57_HIRRU|nr:hypothetical protein DUI87_25246 [Hirundo rustica rustica]
MWGPEPPAGPGSPDCPDLLQHVQALRSPARSPATPLYLSFFEEECRAIAARLRLGAAAEPSPGLGELSALRPESAGPATSTPLPSSSHGRLSDSSAGDCEAAAAPAPGEPGRLPQPAADGGPGARPARPPAQSRRVRRGPGQPSGGGPGTPARSPGRGRARLAAPRTRASLGLQLPAAGTGRGAWETRLLRPPGATTQELVCNRTQELKENGESKERLAAARNVLGAGKTDQTWVCGESSLSCELAPGLTSGCEDAVPAVQSAGDQLSQELERVKKELEQVKGELADKTAQCEAYQQTISSLQAQLRAAGICLKDAAVFDNGGLGRD